MGLRSVSVAPRLEDGAKKDQVLSNSFSLLRHHRSEATGHADVATENDRTEATLALAQRVKLQETSAAAAGRRVKELRQNLTQQEEMFQAQQAQLTEKQRQIAELQRAVSSLQAQAKEEVAADHGLELKYQQQAEEYQKDVEHLDLWRKKAETALRGAKEQLSGLRQTQLRDQEELTEGKHRLQKDESHVQLQQQKRQEEEYHEDAMQRQAEAAFWVSACLLEAACLLWLIAGLKSFLHFEGKTSREKLALFKQRLSGCWRSLRGRRLDKRTAEEQDWMRCRLTYRVWTAFIGFGMARVIWQQLRVCAGFERQLFEIDALAIVMATAGLLLQLMPSLLNPRSLDPWYIVTSLLVNLTFLNSKIDAREALILIHGLQMILTLLAKRTWCSIFCTCVSSSQILWMANSQGIEFLDGEALAPLVLIFVIPIVFICGVLKMDLQKRTVELGAVSSLLLVCYDAVVPADETLTLMEDSPQLSGLLLHTVGLGLAGRSFLDFCSKDDHDRIADHFFSSLTEGAPVMALNLDMLDADQNHLKVEIIHARFTNLSNERCFLIGVREIQYMDAGPAPLTSHNFAQLRRRAEPTEPEPELKELRLTFDVLQLKDDIDTSLVQAGAASVASRSSHEQRLTEVVRVAARKQQEIQELQANVSGLEAQVQQETMQLDQLRSKEHFDTEKVKEEIQEVRQKKLYRLRAAQDMYHKLPEVFRQRAKVDEERRKNEAFEASQSRTQQQLLREEKLKESEKQEEEELHTELRSSKQRLQSINPRANGKKSVAKKRVQQLRAKLADTKRDEAKEQKKFMERSTALQQEIRQEEGRGRRKSSEKARAVEKMQGELLALEDKIDSLGRQQNQLAAEAAQLQSSFSLKQMQDQQEVHHAKTEAERKRLQLTEVEKEHRRTAQEASLQWKTQLQQEQLTQATHLASLKHRMEEKVEELRHRDAIELEGLQALAGTVKAKHSSAAKLTRFLEREPRLASAAFRPAVLRLLKAAPVVGALTAPIYGHRVPFVEEIRKRREVKVVQLKPSTRQEAGKEMPLAA
eukprot:s126_g22.t3